MSYPATPASFIEAKTDEWADYLIDLGANNTLLSFKATKTTSLDLTEAVRDQVMSLLQGQKCRLTNLLPDPERRASALKQAQGLRRRIGQLNEEQGLDPARLAQGLLLTEKSRFAGTGNLFPMRAPLLLWPVVLRSISGGADFELEITDEPEPNVVLLHALHRLIGVDLDVAAESARLTAAIEASSDPMTQFDDCVEILRQVIQPAGVPVQLDTDNVALGLFSYEKLPMVNDLRQAKELLAAHEVVAILAGAPGGRAVKGDQEWEPQPLDHIQPQHEFLVAEADSSQNRAINAVLHGQDAVIVGPPGTGKSQTIANIIAGAAALGKRVLFVAEKRAAIEAVTQRLEGAGLDGLVFDLHQRSISRREIARQLADTLDRASRTPPAPDDTELHHRLYETRREAALHAYHMHIPIAPWGRSPYQVICDILALPEEAETSVRFRGAALSGLDGDRFRQAARNLQQFFDLGGPRIRRRETPWWNAEVHTEDDVRNIRTRLDYLTTQALLRNHNEMEALLGAAGLIMPSDLHGWRNTLELLRGASETISEFGPAVFHTDLSRLAAATGTRAYRVRVDEPLPWRVRRALKREVRQWSRSSLQRSALHEALVRGIHQQAHWAERSISGVAPIHIEGIAEALDHFTDLYNHLAAIAMCVRVDEHLIERPTNEIDARLRELDADRETLDTLVKVNGLAASLETLGMGALLDELCTRNVSPERVQSCFEWAWLHSLADELKSQVPQFGGFSSAYHERLIAEFATLDRQHLAHNRRRVERRAFEHLHAVRQAYPEQAQLIATEAKKKAKHKPLRELLDKAPDVLLSLHPCWAMSPLIVSRMLPARKLFDLVIFDEASQVAPHDAVTSIMRGSQLVVAGDSQQLPPTNFFRKILAYDEDGENDNDDGLEVFASILDVLEPKLKKHVLEWHYRSRDERLIAFSNRHFYNGQLIAFPGCQAGSPVRLEVVDGRTGPGAGGVASEEVRRVVELVMDHARHRPHESLGVIAFSDKHADRIEGTLRQVRQDNPDAEDFFSDERPADQRFFIKNLERVQGDERNSIILTIGHAKAPTGALHMHFGPLSMDGGERRLNVAITRAKHHLTVVTSFTASDMRTDGRGRGIDLLRQFLEYAGNGQRLDAIGQSAGVPQNGFERSVRDALVRQRVPVHPQWGVGGYRIDFALAHPHEPGRMVLAVETDGDRYHRSHSTRDRDRLRQSHLEALGWRFVRVWASEWFKHPQQELGRIMTAWRDACDSPECDGSTSIDLRHLPSLTLGQSGHPIGEDRGPSPVPRRDSVSEYSDDELLDVFRWMLRDGLLIDQAGRLAEARELLNIKQLRNQTRQRLYRALDAAEQSASRPR